MTQLSIKPRELPIIFAALILLALITEGYLDQHQWIIWLTIAAIPTWIILGKRKTTSQDQKPHHTPTSFIQYSGISDSTK
ncbi:MAG: hypothetical protein ABIJ47_08055 [Candidatus Bathyarchaeota archaeon]